MASKRRTSGTNVVFDDIMKQQIYLERFKLSLVSDFDNAIVDVQNRITGILNNLDSDDLSDLNRTQLNALLSKLRNTELQIYTGQTDRLVNQLTELSDYSANVERKTLKKYVALSDTDFEIVNNLKVSNWDFVSQQPIAATGQLLESFVKDFESDALSRVEGAVRNGWAQGKTVSEVTRELKGTKAKNYTDGIIGGKDRRHVRTLVNTATQQVANSARAKVWEDNSDLVQGYKWVSTLDRSTSPQCRGLDGQKFELGKGPLPPIHVNCRSTTIADLGEEFDFLDEGATRSSEEGYVPADETYYDWLKRQDRDFVEDTIGPSRTKLFLDSNLSPEDFRKLNFDKTFQPITLAEMKAKDPEAFEKAGVKVSK